MSAYYVEVCGVFLGFVRPFMGGLLVMPAGTGKIGWGWGYGGPVVALERARKEQG